MKRFKKSNKKGPVRAKKASADGIQFRSFKRWCVNNGETRTLYKPQNQTDVAAMIKLILDGRK